MASSIIVHAGQVLFGKPVFGLTGYLLATVLGILIRVNMLRSGQREEGNYHEK